MMSAAPRLTTWSCSSTGGNSARLKARALYHTDSRGARQRTAARRRRLIMSGAAFVTDRPTSTPRQRGWRRRMLRPSRILVGALTLLALTAVGVATAWRYTV